MTDFKHFRLKIGRFGRGNWIRTNDDGVREPHIIKKLHKIGHFCPKNRLFLAFLIFSPKSVPNF